MKSKLITIAALSGLMVLNGCGDTRNPKADAVSGLAGALSSGNSKVASISRNIQRVAIAQKNRDSLEKFIKTVRPAGAVCDAIAANYEPDPSCSISSCSDTDNNDVTVTIGCSDLNTYATCGSDTYTLTNFDYSTTMHITPIVASFTMTMDGTVDGGAFNNTALVCSMVLSIDLAASSPAAELDCNDVNFSCSFSGETLSCADIESAAASTTCAAK